MKKEKPEFLKIQQLKIISNIFIGKMQEWIEKRGRRPLPCECLKINTKANELKGKTLEEKFLKMKNPSKELVEILQEFDQLYNVKWPMVHLETAQHYLDKKGENKAATGGSEWKKYLHPKHQQRKFFPEIWEDNYEG